MNKRQTEKRNKRIAQAAAILGALGGASRSPAKAAASRANGKKGGRPRKDAAREGATDLKPNNNTRGKHEENNNHQTHR